jgi:HEAT repeat protein
MCCFDDAVAAGSRACGGCRLEGDGSFTMHSDDKASGTPVRFDPERFVVLFRVEAGRVNRIRALSEECALDAGGRAFVWLTDVRPAESLALLASYLDSERRLADSALAAIAFHADPAADAVIEKAVTLGQPEERRKQAAFWLGNARGRRGYEMLRSLVREDPIAVFREHVVFALSQSRVAEALDTMIDVARRDVSPRVRGQALFWLAQKAGHRAAVAITDAIRDDPETEVKKKAVFALSQRPKDEGVPLLISTARTNRNPVVRKQAMFWLGQSEDPRALAFFEEVLAR